MENNLAEEEGSIVQQKAVITREQITNDVSRTTALVKYFQNIDTQKVIAMSRFQSKHLIGKRSSKTEVDAICLEADYRFTYWEIFQTAISILFRSIAVCSNVRLAYEFQIKGEKNFFAWTILYIILSLVVTSIIHFYICNEDSKFKKGLLRSLLTFLLILGSAVFLRYFNCLVYAIRCKRAELNGDKLSQMDFFKLAVREESDVAFIRLFECFLEWAPQKILQISIVLNQYEQISYDQVIIIFSYFGSIAWSLSVYHRYVRYAQEDKHNINFEGHLCHLCWHFCIAASRTLCIAFVASIFPLWTLLGCLCHAVIFGSIIFIIARPKCPKNSLANLLFCFLFGIIYLFTFISTREGKNQNKYIFYYIVCGLENIGCIVIFIAFTSSNLKSNAVVFYSLCIGVFALYALGILVMILYYTRYHPQITARESKQFMINNN